MLLFCPTCANILECEEGLSCYRFACSTCPFINCLQRLLGFVFTFIYKVLLSNCFVFVFAFSFIRDFALENVFVFVLLLKMMSLMGRIPESETNGKEQERRQSLACAQLYIVVVQLYLCWNFIVVVGCNARTQTTLSS